MKIATALSAALFLLLPTSARADEPPSRGVGYIVAGSVFTGLGVANLATSPICLAIQDQSVHTPCLAASIAVGGTFLLVGVPLLVVGVGKRREFKEWQATHAAAGLGFVPTGRGGVLTYSTQF